MDVDILLLILVEWKKLNCIKYTFFIIKIKIGYLRPSECTLFIANFLDDNFNYFVREKQRKILKS